MPLLSRHRRYLGLLFVGILALLLLGNVVPDPLGRGIWRTKGSTPSNVWQQMIGNLQSAGLYLQDNFGFRASLPILRREVRDALASPDDRNIYMGRTGRLLWARENTPEQSAGALVRTEAVERFVRMVEIFQREMKPLGTKVVVAVPPNTQSVDLDALPAWQKDFKAKPTEYDLMLAGLKAGGITAVDLRAALKAAPFEGPRYLSSDSHWNNASSVYAFNATMVAAGHPDWQVDPKELIGPLVPMPGGDLTRSMRMAPDIADANYGLKFRPTEPAETRSPALKLTHEHPTFQPYVQHFADTGPRVLVIGDSFTAHIWTHFFAFTPVAEAAWMHFSRRTLGHCGFDVADIKAYKPDLVILARTERFFPCLNGAWPYNLPKQ